MRDAPSRTAEAVCFCRASELARPVAQRIVDDPLAPCFLRPSARATIGALRRSAVLARLEAWVEPRIVAYVVARHRFMDDALLAAAHRVEQVLVLGAGYDTRAWRFAEQLGDRPVYEVDHPSTSARRARRMLACGLVSRARRVDVDFETERLDERLLAAGFAPGRPTFVIWEGVTMYLRAEAVEGTLSMLRGLCGVGSELVLDAWFVDRPTDHGASRLLRVIGEPVRFGLASERMPGFLGERGWDVVDIATAPELERRYVRDARRVYGSTYVVRATLA